MILHASLRDFWPLIVGFIVGYCLGIRRRRAK